MLEAYCRDVVAGGLIFRKKKKKNTQIVRVNRRYPRHRFPVNCQFFFTVVTRAFGISLRSVSRSSRSDKYIFTHVTTDDRTDADESLLPRPTVRLSHMWTSENKYKKKMTEFSTPISRTTISRNSLRSKLNGMPYDSQLNIYEYFVVFNEGQTGS